MVAVLSWQGGFHNIKNVPSFLPYFAVLSLAYGFHPQDRLVIIGWLLQVPPSHLLFRREEGSRGKDKKKAESLKSLSRCST